MASISVTGYAIQGGADQDKLSITSSGGVPTFDTASEELMVANAFRRLRAASNADPARRGEVIWWGGQ